jgi:hypothetical protein
MKIIYGTLILVLLTAALYFGWAIYFSTSFTSGIGGGKVYKFDCERQELYSCLKSFYNKNLNYHVPEKWIELDLSIQPYYQDLDELSFYFRKTKNEPEEMYFVSLIKEELSDTTFTKPSHVSVRSVYQTKEKNSADNEEQKRTDTRFKTNILDKLNLDS